MTKTFQIIILVISSLLLMSSSCDKGSEGCTDIEACNFDSIAIVEDGSCQYPEENYDCTGNCMTEIDCVGTCGGTAETDCCGLCDNDGNNNPPEGSNGNCIESEVECGCIDLTKCNVNPNANYDDGSCAPELSDFGGLSDGTDCNGVCGGTAVIDNCELCIGGETNLGQSWRLKIISEVTFTLSNGLQIGTDKDSVILGSSIFARDGYNGTELNGGNPSCENCYIDVPEPLVSGSKNKSNFIRFYFPHNDESEQEEWSSQFELSNLLFDGDIRANDYYSLLTNNIGLTWYAEIKPFLSDTSITDDFGNSITYSPMIDLVKLDFIYLEGISAEESEKFSIKVFLDREQGETKGGIECQFIENEVNLSVDTDKIIKLIFNISNLCFAEF